MPVKEANYLVMMVMGVDSVMPYPSLSGTPAIARLSSNILGVDVPTHLVLWLANVVPGPFPQGPHPP